ncbi:MULTISPECIES: hypothetical protein [Vibrio]|uniref:hypothetical protein n=1 Tax=Vibrio TaxID=662 RepID=UPI002074D053|nr:MULTISPECIES: hypothetical protein [Vibrio]USD35527.1 hypothetical protein J8Z27_23185 [Vibrio sp. SCSIO 43186]USD72651.1 hypothetical protein J4N41_23190 [Vibrio sp. SCSIO 43139]USD98862.1 hypothetical protein CTT30_22530 [Vibrio coralliilyticus]
MLTAATKTHNEQRELIYHGTRSERFSQFDLTKLGTGEGAHAANVIYFVTSLKGAYNHASYRARQKGAPLVYVCQFKPDANVLTIDVPICEHPSNVTELWDSLPVWVSTKNSKNWYNELAFTPESSVDHYLPPLDERKRCDMLRSFGFDGIRNFEAGGWADSYLHGRSHVALNPDSVDIIEVWHADDIESEVIGAANNYLLLEHPETLGETGVSSRLKRTSWLNNQ